MAHGAHEGEVSLTCCLEESLSQMRRANLRIKAVLIGERGIIIDTIHHLLFTLIQASAMGNARDQKLSLSLNIDSLLTGAWGECDRFCGDVVKRAVRMSLQPTQADGNDLVGQICEINRRISE